MNDVERLVAQAVPGGERGFGECQTFGFYENGELVAGVVFHDWRPEYETIELSAASVHRRWMTRERLQTIAKYAFETAECRLMLIRTSEHNTRVRRIWKALGANETIVPLLRGPDEGEAICTLTAETWRASKFARPYDG